MNSSLSAMDLQKILRAVKDKKITESNLNSTHKDIAYLLEETIKDIVAEYIYERERDHSDD